MHEARVQATRRISCRQLLLAVLACTPALLALYPLWDTYKAEREGRFLLEQTRALARASEPIVSEERLAVLRRDGRDGRRWVTGLECDAGLHSWGNIGGCGAGGGSASAAGGAKWVGRNVTGGYVDVQLMSSLTSSQGNYFSTFNTRLGTSVLYKWNFGFNVPIVYKVGDVDVLGQTKTASIAGFGDISLEVSRKLGITNSSLLTLTLSGPTGSHDAQREGVVLPQHLQLGSGVLGATGQFEHTMDRDWGLMIFGGSAAYNGWENSLDDWRAPTLTAYSYFAYLLGPFVPSIGLTLFGKPLHDKERGEDRADDKDPLFMVVPSVAIEWSTDILALLLYSSTSFSYNGFESVGLSLGVSSSLF